MNRYVNKLTGQFNKSNFITFLWFVVPFVAVLIEISRGNSYINNYLIFKQVFWHTFHQQNLYSLYPLEYFDKNHYGPLFSTLIAPFAILPNDIGATLWCLLNVYMLFYAVNKLPINKISKNIILLIALIETLTSVQNMQFNPMLTGWILLSFVLIKENKLSLAAMLIVSGTLIKIYGIVGLPFILFSNNQKKAVYYLILWSLVLFCLPMLFSSPHFVLKSYYDWFLVLVEKNIENVSSYQNSGMTDISIMGCIKRITGFYTIQNLFFIIPAAFLMTLPLLRFSKIDSPNFQLTYLAQVLIGLVIFSTSAESPTYVIAVTGFGIWYALHSHKKSLPMFLLLIFVLILTVFSPTDLFPRYLREEFVIKYSLKALPCFVAWCCITYNLLLANFTPNLIHEKNN